MHIINISAVIYSAKKSDSLPFQQIRVQLRVKGLKKVALMQVYSFNLYHVSVWTQCGSKGLQKGFMWLNSANAPLP